MEAVLDLLIKNGTIVTESQVFQADIGIESGVITQIAKGIKGTASQVLDAGHKLILPGGIDAHTHFEMPFMGTYTADDFESGTIAAACGGITTIVDFAVQQKGELLFEALKNWRQKADPKVFIDYGLHMIIRDLNQKTFDEIKKVIEYGIPSFKLFMTYRKEGLLLDDGSILQIMQEVAKYGGLVGLHCENNDLIEYFSEALLREGKREARYHPDTRPGIVEGEAVRRALILAEYAGANMYAVHISSKLGMEAIRDARRRGVAAFAETCPHYLVFTDEVYSRPNGINFVMSPPIKREIDRTAIWGGLASGDVKTMGSDHACFTSEQKLMGGDDFTQIPNGVAGTEVIIPILYSEGVRKGVIGINRLVQVTSYNTARLFGLWPQKGTIAVGSDADLVIFDPEKKMRLTVDNLHSKIDYSIYENYTCHGYPAITVSRGEIVQKNGHVQAKKGRGRFLKAKPYPDRKLPAL
ncbi:MAG: dihydropyrimidinase [Candidatus Bathyarchaeia archaeon]